MKAKIIYVAILVEDDDRFDISDIINETLRESSQDVTNSGVIDYAFNFNGGCPNLPPPQDYEYTNKYEEGDFVGSVRPYIGNANL